MRDSVPSASYSSVCNVLRQWNIPLIPTYRVYRLYDILVSNWLIVVLMTIRLGIHVSPTITSDATTFKACKNNK